MNTAEMIKKIAVKGFDVDEFVEFAINDEHARNAIIHHMITSEAIMTYYHCYYVVEKASQYHPHMFYTYWDDIAALLHHANSYHRDFALEIIGNLTKVDHENRFAEIADEYFRVVNDEKFMTGNCCVKNFLKIYRHKPEHRGRIIDILLHIDILCDYTEKQKEVLKADVLEIFDAVYADAIAQDDINEYIRAGVDSMSPKTRKKAKELVKKYGL